MQPADAVRILFGEATDLRRVTPAEVKSAFRRRVRTLHPDSACATSPCCGEAVSSLVSARDILIEHLRTAQEKAARLTAAGHRQQAATASPSRPARPTIVRPRPVTEKLPRKEHERYYTGVFPTYKLKFGQFVYCAGEVSWQDLVRGMRWQRDQRPAYGEIAKAWGWMTDKDIQAVRAATEIPGMFGERAVALGLLTEKQAAFLVRHQHHCQPRLGQYFVKERILLTADVNRLLAAMQRHNASIERGGGPIPPFNPAGLVR
ncbi:hypothetical protein [Trichlorobacter ammonificans]|uniref:J domain-containing protein n=1 Tax=Trichlorobacter ammonificans TaxID=2916410 RepID=A0ABN8HN01_9BACT|nr:hypothetical protein [Trichlorobacter ammonificans]CAH2032525.1 conserved protein of unknown function [Trichlorobacter ammonificans]